MYVFNYNIYTKKINLISVPRDSLIEVQAYDGNGVLRDYWKINSAYALGGEEEVVKNVEKILDININYVFNINYIAFRNFIDAIGGIEVYIEQDMYYDDETQDLHINFKKGETVLLNGKMAEEYFDWEV
ncbi:LCP family protein [Clostridium sp.]|uniref:LCP family protein n=1 Tax=Clostridium sp. TaxID=1506 RepID=UPI0032179CA2